MGYGIRSAIGFLALFFCACVLFWFVIIFYFDTLPGVLWLASHSPESSNLYLNFIFSLARYIKDSTRVDVLAALPSALAVYLMLKRIKNSSIKKRLKILIALFFFSYLPVLAMLSIEGFGALALAPIAAVGIGVGVFSGTFIIALISRLYGLKFAVMVLIGVILFSMGLSILLSIFGLSMEQLYLYVLVDKFELVKYHI